MKKYVALASVFVVSASLLTACTANVAPRSAGDAARGEIASDLNRAGHEANTADLAGIHSNRVANRSNNYLAQHSGNAQDRMTRTQTARGGTVMLGSPTVYNDRQLESRIEAIPGVGNATVFVKGTRAFIGVNSDMSNRPEVSRAQGLTPQYDRNLPFVGGVTAKSGSTTGDTAGTKPNFGSSGTGNMQAHPGTHAHSIGNVGDRPGVVGTRGIAPHVNNNGRLTGMGTSDSSNFYSVRGIQGNQGGAANVDANRIIGMNGARDTADGRGFTTQDRYLYTDNTISAQMRNDLSKVIRQNNQVIQTVYVTSDPTVLSRLDSMARGLSSPTQTNRTVNLDDMFDRLFTTR